MRILGTFLLAAFLLSARVNVRAAAEDPLAPPGSKQTEPAPPKSNWNVRVEVLMVGLPEGKALALLPALKDEQKVESAMGELLAAIGKKEATLLGWPTLWTLSGQRAMLETIEEKRYPTEFEPPLNDGSAATTPKGAPEKTPAKSPAVDENFGVPAAFETRNCGVTLETEPQVLGDGSLIRISVNPQRVSLLGFDEYAIVRSNGGRYAKVDQPQFASSKSQGEFLVRNGKHLLIAVHRMVKPEGQMELFILQATAIQMK